MSKYQQACETIIEAIGEIGLAIEKRGTCPFCGGLAHSHGRDCPLIQLYHVTMKLKTDPQTEVDRLLVKIKDLDNRIDGMTPGPEGDTAEFQREIVKRWNRAPRAIALLHQVLSFSLCDVTCEMEAVLGDIEAFLTDIEAEEKGL